MLLQSWQKNRLLLSLSEQFIDVTDILKFLETFMYFIVMEAQHTHIYTEYL